MKRCTCCGTEKPLIDFRRDNRPGRSGYKSRCKSCVAERGSAVIVRDSAGLTRYEAARTAIAECKSFDEVKDWADKAAALQEYARRAGDRSMEMDCAEIRVRAARRQGELLGELRAVGKLHNGRKVTGEVPLSLDSLGVTKNESSRLQKIAAVPPDEFDELLARSRARMEADKAVHVLDVFRERDGPVNGARAVMGSRKEPCKSLNYFPTPPWATRALMEHVVATWSYLPLNGSVWEPACGEGHMAEVLKEYFGEVAATDIYDYGYGDGCADFLNNYPADSDWIITNPPFGAKTEAFVLRALDLARVGVAMFVRLQWLESVGRYEAIFRDHPPTQIAFFAERVNLCKGRWDPDGTTATAYIWLVWIKGAAPRPPMWVPPGQRETLTRPDDRERFTAHPVMARETAGSVSAPVSDGATLIDKNSNEPVLLAATHPRGESDLAVTQDYGAGSPFPAHDFESIPEFLRR